MVSKELEVGFNPPVEKEVVDERAMLILDIIEQKGCTYPNEICGELDISKETVYRKLRFLEKGGKIEHMTFNDTLVVPKWLQPRMADLWSRGLKGNAIRRMSWYMVAKDETKK